MATRTTMTGVKRYLLVATFVFGAFFGAYRFAVARSAQVEGVPVSQVSTISVRNDSGNAPVAPGCACCGSVAPTENGITGDPARGVAVLEGDIQRIDVDLSKGYYDPNVIVLKAGVPAEITFGQSSGCTAQVMSKDLDFFEDLTAGPKTVKLPALDAGEYAFSCGMEMVFGKIVVE